MKNLVMLLKEAAETESGITFYKSPKEFNFLKYSALWNQSNLYAQQLIDLGVERGDKVALMLPSDESFIAQFFACLQVGAIPTALYPPVRLGRLDDWKATIEKQLAILQPAVVLTNKQIKPFLGERIFYQHIKLGVQILECEQSKNSFKDIYENDIAFIQFSSGTTGHPKPVYLSHQAVLANIAQITETLPNLNSMVHSCCSWLPLYHDMGLVGGLLSSIQQKVHLILIRPEQFLARPLSWFEAISKFKVTVTLAPNFAFGLCQKRIRDEQLEDLSLSSLMVTMCGAEMVHPKTLKEFSQRFSSIGFDDKTILPVYGMAEATLAVTFHTGGENKRWYIFDREKLESGTILESSEGIELASLGHPLRNVKLKILNNEGESLENAIGEVAIKTPSLFTQIGDMKAPEWYLTGDLGFIYQGQLFIVGRKKDMIIHLGRNIDPTQIERLADNHESVRKGCSAAVAHYNHDLGREEIILFYESDNDNQNLNGEVEREVLTNLGLKISAIGLKPGTIFRTSSGKIQRQKTLQAHMSHQLIENKISIPKIMIKRAQGQIYHLFQESRFGK